MAMRKGNAVALGCILIPWGTLAAPVAMYLFEKIDDYLLIDLLFGFGLICCVTTFVLYQVYCRVSTPSEWRFAMFMATTGAVVAVILAVFGLVCGPYIAKSQRSVQRIWRLSQWKGIGCAMHNYAADRHDLRLPPQAITDRDGKPLLSWRVLLLPYLEEGELFKQFRLDEPWDSDHNKPLLSRMPKVYRLPYPIRVPKYHTFYQVIVGPKTAFDHGSGGVKFADISDGMSNTILLAEARRAVPWTKPEDIVYDPKKPLPKFGARSHSDGHSIFFGQRKSMNALIYFLMCDTSTEYFRRESSTDATLRNAIERNDGNMLLVE